MDKPTSKLYVSKIVLQPLYRCLTYRQNHVGLKIGRFPYGPSSIKEKVLVMIRTTHRPGSLRRSYYTGAAAGIVLASRSIM
ncbi:hypothetical protein TNCV_3885391 [Trichonephila clavipes]|nr:hypothetical protein TNCV_3885391 [Trichonephila clavipes]